MEEITKLLKAVAEHPEDWVRYSILADAFEEMGDEKRAKGCRWAHVWKKRPFTASSRGFHWYDNEETPVNDPIDPASDLPSDIYRELIKMESVGSRRYKKWVTFQGAFLALLETWVKK